ncbi:flagellar assembly protein FliW [Exiguobacterium sp. SH3S2]|uniref:flagellar assembly protein FliW n=1 Tax=unclassified Exiguobacterium TaxID=2644629 RepID=UPI0010400B9D|nr:MULTISPECIES: flagellar assembly protein FliW [unclassified Exiguobacterium]TCI41587.1 flagellar assembly protein FliW [Exiguobacterium sp. SH3S3]TCI51409.1 flagellar assembly protein FliW [Exiguobacterium sp. SH5S13]TCI58203.1 flagellar assembly protein FliW [Exiguobacterium sp. SH3S2]
MFIETDYFGKIEVKEEETISFVSEVPGFPDSKTFVLIPYGDDLPFWSLQSIEDAACAFVVTNPFWHKADYAFELTDGTKEQLAIGEAEHVSVYAIVTLREPFDASTLNLKAPIVIETKERRGKQVILDDAYSARYPLGGQKAEVR